jgi:hypothetical protein
MPLRALFGISVILSFISWGIIARRYIWPALRRVPRAEAMRRLLLLHTFRFVGLAFVIPGVVSPDLPAAFARPAAYGDLSSAILALLAIATLGRTLGIILAWAFNIFGAADLLYAFYEGNRVHLDSAPGLQGAAYFIPTVLVPLLLITHTLVFLLLLKPREVEVVRNG